MNSRQALARIQEIQANYGGGRNHSALLALEEFYRDAQTLTGFSRATMEWREAVGVYEGLYNAVEAMARKEAEYDADLRPFQDMGLHRDR